MYLRASGTSMFPFIRERDVLLIDECVTDNLHTADIAVYKIEGKSFAHRVLWNAKDFLFLKADTHFSVEKIYKSQIVGKVKAITRNGKLLDIEVPLNKIYSILLAICLLPISLAYNIWVAATLGLRFRRFPPSKIGGSPLRYEKPAATLKELSND